MQNIFLYSILYTNKKTLPVVFYNWQASFVCLQAPSINHYVNPCSDLNVYLTRTTMESRCYENKRFFLWWNPFYSVGQLPYCLLCFPRSLRFTRKKYNLQNRESKTHENYYLYTYMYIYNWQQHAPVGMRVNVSGHRDAEPRFPFVVLPPVQLKRVWFACDRSPSDRTIFNTHTFE